MKKNSAINAPIWHNVNNHKNKIQKEHIALWIIIAHLTAI